ncbi:hypothetical protein C0993_002671 [Termitomyces sp. T159_Od127]|nr:hypothetical protein C0993_002671 [Termitomyces sp. T159_Od127]
MARTASSNQNRSPAQQTQETGETRYALSEKRRNEVFKSSLREFQEKFEGEEEAQAAGDRARQDEFNRLMDEVDAIFDKNDESRQERYQEADANQEKRFQTAEEEREAVFAQEERDRTGAFESEQKTREKISQLYIATRKELLLEDQKCWMDRCAEIEQALTVQFNKLLNFQEESLSNGSCRRNDLVKADPEAKERSLYLTAGSMVTAVVLPPQTQRTLLSEARTSSPEVPFHLLEVDVESVLSTEDVEASRESPSYGRLRISSVQGKRTPSPSFTQESMESGLRIAGTSTQHQPIYGAIHMPFFQMEEESSSRPSFISSPSRTPYSETEFKCFQYSHDDQTSLDPSVLEPCTKLAENVPPQSEQTSSTNVTEELRQKVSETSTRHQVMDDTFHVHFEEAQRKRQEMFLAEEKAREKTFHGAEATREARERVHNSAKFSLKLKGWSDLSDRILELQDKSSDGREQARSYAAIQRDAAFQSSQKRLSQKFALLLLHIKQEAEAVLTVNTLKFTSRKEATLALYRRQGRQLVDARPELYRQLEMRCEGKAGSTSETIVTPFTCRSTPPLSPLSEGRRLSQSMSSVLTSMSPSSSHRFSYGSLDYGVPFVNNPSVVFFRGGPNIQKYLPIPASEDESAEERRRTKLFEKSQEERKEAFEKAIRNRQGIFTSNEAKRRDEFIKAQDIRKKRFERDEAGRERSFLNAQKIRENKFQNAERDRGNKFEEGKMHRNAQFRAMVEERERRFQDLQTDLQRRYVEYKNRLFKELEEWGDELLKNREQAHERLLMKKRRRSQGFFRRHVKMPK